MMSKMDDWLKLDVPSGAGSMVVGNSQSDIDVFRRQLDIEMGKASPDSLSGVDNSQGIMGAIRAFGNKYIQSEQAYRSSMDSLLTQSFPQAAPVARDYSVTGDGIQAGTTGRGYDSYVQSTLGNVGPDALGLPRGPGGAGWTGGANAVTAYNQPQAGTNEVPVDNETGGSGGSSNDPIRQTQEMMQSLMGDMWRITFTNMSVSKTMQNFGQHNAIAAAGTDIMRGLVSGLTKGG
jgi:hypothetical protein